MKFNDLLRLTVSTFVVYRMRSFLTGLGIAIGVAAVILLTSIAKDCTSICWMNSASLAPI